MTNTGTVTVYGATSIGGAITATSTLNVTGLTTLTNASTTQLSITGNLWINGFATTTSSGNIQGQGILTMLGTGTSTFSGGIQSTALNITSATASSTFANGIILSKGCFLMPDGTCAGAGGGGGTINSGTTGQLSYYAGSGTTLTATSSLFIHSNQNVGIGTTTPNWLLQAAGTRPFLTLSDTGAAANNKHWFLSSQGGNFYVGTSSDALNATSTYLTIANGGNVGIGVSNPTTYLHVGSGGVLDAVGAKDVYIQNKTEIDDRVFVSIGGGIYTAIEHSQGVAYSGAVNAFVGSGGDTLAPFHAGINSCSNKNCYSLIGLVNAGSSYNSDNMVALVQNKYIPGVGFAGQSNTTSGTGMVLSASINAIVDSIVSSGVLPTSLVFHTSATNNADLTERLRITSRGFVGIGTTTPNWKLQIASSSPSGTSFALSDISAGTNLKHWLISNQGGNLYFATSSDAYATSTSNLLNLISSNYSVGIGTTSPAEQLSVSGRLFVGGTGTSTIQNNLYVIGTLRSTVSYVGDLVFANNFRFTEALLDSKIQSLFLQNQYGENIFKINEKGQIAVKEIQTGNIEAEKGNFKQGNFEEGNFLSKLQIGSPQNRTGITIYDKDTGKPYCIEMRRGQVVNKEGECK